MDLPRCRLCHGFGKDLVTNSEQICSHCARQTKAFFDPETNAWCQQGYLDISARADGGVLKKIIKEGSSASGPLITEGCPTFVQYIGRLEDGSIFDTTRDVVDGKHVGGTDDLFEFRLGHGKVIPGWDIGVATMLKGEIASFVIQSKYAYGQDGFAPKVEPNMNLVFEIELVRYGTPLPKFPTPEELAASRREIEEENLKQMEENPPPTLDERVQNACKEKDLGNKLVGEGKYLEAKDKYDSGFVYMFVSKEELEFLSAEEIGKVNDMKLLLHLNRALTKIKMDQHAEALWDCDQAIAINDSKIKAHFRRGQCYIAKLKAELEKETLGEFWVFEKALSMKAEAKSSLDRALALSQETEASGAEIHRTLAEWNRCAMLLQKYMKRYERDEKKLYKEKIFDKMEAQNVRRQEREKQKQLEAEFDDMPPLE